ncbi:hypothetical protein [Kordia sp.]|uniref:hypothetical protein n=1 Tax=Kordia sp. TaxID=1965332 RepID=UPI003D6BD694
MKRKSLQGLRLKKENISNLSKEELTGGAITGGCSDGCTPFQSAWNCTRGNCTGDCENGSQSCYCTR